MHVNVSSFSGCAINTLRSGPPFVLLFSRPQPGAQDSAKPQTRIVSPLGLWGNCYRDSLLLSSVGHDSEWVGGQFKSAQDLPGIGSSVSKMLVTSCPTTFNGSLLTAGLTSNSWPAFKTFREGGSPQSVLALHQG